MSKAVVELKDVCFAYGQHVVLRDINLSIGPNLLLGIIGPNGGGKTTLLKILLGLVKPTRGNVHIFGKAPEIARASVGYVPQHGLFDKEFPVSVLDVVLMGRLSKQKLFRNFSGEDVLAAEQALDELNLLHLKNRQIGELSEGERQRTLIARALVNQPELLLLDEPTSSVDQRMQTSLYELLRRLKEKITIIMISHDIGVISSYVDKIACLNVRFFFHDSKEIRKEDLEEAYQCPVELIGHGIPHRVMHKH